MGSLLYNGEPVSFPTQKVKLLLAYLVLENGRPHARTRVAALLWPEHPERDGRNSLRQALAQLRTCLGERQAAHPLITATRTVLRLDLREPLEVDVLRLAAVAARADEADEAELESVSEGIMGPVLDGIEVPESELTRWLEAVRHDTAESAVRLLVALARRREAAGDRERADALASRALAVRSTCEPAWRLRMEVAAAEGRREAALRLYEQCHETLIDTLGVRPSEPTVALQRALVADQVPAVVAPVQPTPTRRVQVRPLREQLGARRPVFGRDVDRAEVVAELRAGRRLITLQGPGGIGKTRLAEAVAVDAEAALELGVVWVSLTSAVTQEDLTAACLDAVEVRRPESASAVRALVDTFGELSVLLVLDEMEGLARSGAHAELLQALLAGCAGVVLLATTRTPLRLTEERVVRVEGLGVTADAAALFVDRVRDLHGGDVVCEPADVAAVCEAVQGVPLALELAARLTRTLSLPDLARLLPDSPELLESDAHDQDPRHRSLEAVFSSTWKALSASARIAAARLALFHGPFELEAANAVAGLTPALLAELIDSSLIRQVSHRRYGLHTYLRDRCARELAEMEPDGRTQGRHADWFCSRVCALVPRAWGPFQPAELFSQRNVHDDDAAASLIAEHADVSAALRLRLERGVPADAEPALSLWCQHLGQRGRWLAAEAMLAQALALHPIQAPVTGVPPQILWTLLLGDAKAERWVVDEAIDAYEGCLALLGEPVARPGWRRRLPVLRLIAQAVLRSSRPALPGPPSPGDLRQAVMAHATAQLMFPYLLRAGVDAASYAIARAHTHLDAGGLPPGLSTFILSNTASLLSHFRFRGAVTALRSEAVPLRAALPPEGLWFRATVMDAAVAQLQRPDWPVYLDRLEDAWRALSPALRVRPGVAAAVPLCLGSLYHHCHLGRLRRWVERGLTATEGGSHASRVVFHVYDALLRALEGDFSGAWAVQAGLIERDRRSGRVAGERILVKAIASFVGVGAGALDAAADLADPAVAWMRANHVSVGPWTTMLALGPTWTYAALAERDGGLSKARLGHVRWLSRGLWRSAAMVPLARPVSLLVQAEQAWLQNRSAKAKERWTQALQEGQAREVWLPALLASVRLRQHEETRSDHYRAAADDVYARMGGDPHRNPFVQG